MSIRTAAFTEVVRDVSGGNAKLPQSAFLKSGVLAVVDQGQDFVAGFTDDDAYRFRSETLPVVVFGDHTKAIKYVDFPFAMGADGVKVLKPTDDCDIKYLYHFLRQARIPDAGYSRHYKFLKELRVPLPPLPEQRRIAAILDKADALRAKRGEAIAKLDQLLQSVFFDMFGDPVTNPKGWPIRAIADLAAVLRDGPFGSNLKSEHYKASGIRVVRLQNIGVWEFLVDDAAYISEDHYASLPKNHCKAGDVLIGTLGDPNLRACILPPSIDRALNKADCLLFRPEPTRATAEYICGLLNSPSLIGSAEGLALGQTRLRISMGRLKELSVPMPPLPEQQRFTSFCTRFYEQASTVARQEKRQSELFAALQQAAFSGSL